ncbi:hypothetical protein Tco_0409744 [Tanacetum coccineum]
MVASLLALLPKLLADHVLAFSRVSGPSLAVMPFPLSAILGGGVEEKSDELELNNCVVNCSKGTLSKVTGLMEFRGVGTGMGMSMATLRFDDIK